jgi:hypothetical protein
MQDEAEQLTVRDRLMRQMAATMSPEERVARAREMHEWALCQLQSNPEAFERFYRRNLRARAVRRHDGV